MTIVARANTEGAATVAHIADGRETASLDSFWSSLSPEQLASVQAVGMDCWDPEFTK